MSRAVDDPRLPRLLHPAAWWAWAIGLAMAASRTTNPLLLALVLAVAGYVVAGRRELRSGFAVRRLPAPRACS